MTLYYCLSGCKVAISLLQQSYITIISNLKISSDEPILLNVNHLYVIIIWLFVISIDLAIVHPSG